MSLWTTTELVKSAYSPDYEPMEVPLVDAAVQYNSDRRVYILLIRNAEALSRNAEEGDFKMSIGSTYAPHSTLLTVTSDDDCSDDPLEEPEESEEDERHDMEDVIDSAMAHAWWTDVKGGESLLK
jgi:hypothetical protein